METLKLIKLSEDSPKKEGYYFCILHNSQKEKLWFSFKYGFETESETVYGWYSDEVEVVDDVFEEYVSMDIFNELLHDYAKVVDDNGMGNYSKCRKIWNDLAEKHKIKA